MFLGNSVKNSCKNLYLHPRSFKIIIKSDSYLTSVSRRGSVTPSTPAFPNINLKKTIGNLLVVSKITEKWLQQSLLPSLFLWYEIKITFLSDVTFPLRSANSVNPNFPNTNLKKTIGKTIHFLSRKSRKKGWYNLFFHPYTFYERLLFSYIL